MSDSLPAPEQSEAPDDQQQPVADTPAEELDNDENEEEDDDEPKLKYTKLTGSLTNVYRNGDSTSAFTVAGDKMVLGSHNGNIHVLSLPTLQSLRTYHAHSATITSVSVSPTPPPPSTIRNDSTSHASSSAKSTARGSSKNISSPSTARTQPPSLANTASNNIFISTSSLDGHVCISSLLDPKDVQLRNFARPVSAVALSPDYKNDRTYLSGGLAGSLILTVGGKAGVTVDANTNSTAAAASAGFLGAIGLGSGDRGKDTVLHGGEGAISAVKWSLTGKWVVWVNEEGIKIMRSHLRLGSEESEDAWRRIAHAARPNRRGWEEMAGVWKGRVEWVDDSKLEADDEVGNGLAEEGKHRGIHVNGTNSASKKPKKKSKIEKLVVGWGDTAWILHVTEGGTTAQNKRQVGSADIIHKLQFRDCIISGISLYTPSLLAILAYRTRDDDDKPITSADQPKKAGRQTKHTGLAPQLRLVNVRTGEEDEIDELSISRFETLSAQDYHLGSLFIPPPSLKEKAAAERGALEGLWDATTASGKYATRIFSSGASVLSRSSSGQEEVGANGQAISFVTSPENSAVGVAAPSVPRRRTDAHPYASSPGLKIFIHSPYDCVLAVKRDLKDHLSYLLKEKQYRQAWELVERHPEVVEVDSASSDVAESQPDTPVSRAQDGTLADFFADGASAALHGGLQGETSAAQKEKRRIGDLWLQQLVAAERWEEAGKVAGKVLGTSRRWEHWVLTFAQAEKFDEITLYIPPTSSSEDVDALTALPTLVYEVVLGHYVLADPSRLNDLLEVWRPERELYDGGSVSKAIEARLRNDGHDGNDGNDDTSTGAYVREGSEDWRLLTESLAKLYLADGRAKEALRCYIRAQNAEKTMQLIREEKLVDVIAAEDVPGLLMLRVSKEQMRSAPLSELDEASSEAVQLLAEESVRGGVRPADVIQQLERRGRSFRPFLFFYMRALWRGAGADGSAISTAPSRRPLRRGKFSDARRTFDEGQALVEDHADLAVELFAEYDREMLKDLLQKSELYSPERAAAICEQRHYTPELVDVLSKMGQKKDALFLIIGELGDVTWAIDFAKKNPDLWDDLLDYSMDKPAFIQGLLSEVGTAIDPIKLVRRIPEGLEIDGLREGIKRMMREYDIQYSISEGVARVLRGEVQGNMDTLREGQKKGVKFEIVDEEEVAMTKEEKQVMKAGVVEPGYCVGCGELFGQEEKEPLLGFACGHIFHLSCLLKLNPETSDPATISRLQSQLGYGDAAEDSGYSGRSVGAKVAHAHIIRNVVKGGCQRCVVPAGA